VPKLEHKVAHTSEAMAQALACDLWVAQARTGDFLANMKSIGPKSTFLCRPESAKDLREAILSAEGPGGRSFWRWGAAIELVTGHEEEN